MATTRETMLAMLTDLSAKVSDEVEQEKSTVAEAAKQKAASDDVIAGLKAISASADEVIKGLKDKVAALQLAVDDSINFDKESKTIAEIEAAIASISAPFVPVPVAPPVVPVVVVLPVPAEPTVVLPEPPIVVAPPIVPPADPIAPPVVLPVV